jgi:hypothetical protein
VRRAPTERRWAETLEELLEQHRGLERIMDRCDELADAAEAGAEVDGALARAVAQLRIGLDAHNRHEESILRPVLHAADAFGPVRIEQMIAEHVVEHAAMRASLDSGSIAALRATLAALRAHLVDEERHFVTAKILRDDLVTVENGG